MTEYNYNEWQAVFDAYSEALKSTCIKSQRGVIIFNRREGILSRGYNGPPNGFLCNEAFCVNMCSQRAVHAEQMALLRYNPQATLPESKNPFEVEADLLHVRMKNGRVEDLDASPTCLECSKLIVLSGIKRVWLYLGYGRLKVWDAADFHAETLHHHGLMVSLGSNVTSNIRLADKVIKALD